MMKQIHDFDDDEYKRRGKKVKMKNKIKLRNKLVFNVYVFLGPTRDGEPGDGPASGRDWHWHRWAGRPSACKDGLCKDRASLAGTTRMA